MNKLFQMFANLNLVVTWVSPEDQPFNIKLNPTSDDVDVEGCVSKLSAEATRAGLRVSYAPQECDKRGNVKYQEAIFIRKLGASQEEILRRYEQS